MGFPNGFDMFSEAGFWLAEFISRFDAKFENGLINNALKSGLSFSSSTAGETVPTVPGVGRGISSVPDSCPNE